MMPGEVPVILLKLLLLLVSFAGLCAGLRTAFGIDPFVAPAIGACAPVALLCAAGMVGLLYPMWVLLYALGFLGAIYAYVIRRSPPRPLLVLLYLVYAVFLILRFGRSRFYANDDVSHWALVARFLLRYDAFPGPEADFVRFQSYPLGAASFIYYVGRGTLNAEGVYLIAQNFLKGALFCPALACADRRNGKRAAAFSIASFLLFFHFCDKIVTIQVDHLMGFFGICIAALFSLHQSDPERLAAALVPCLLAAVMVKSSGLVFCAASAVGAAVVTRRLPDKKVRLATFAAVLLLPIALYLLWMLRVKLAFPGGMQSKHAVSLAAYLGQLRQKGPATILRITRQFMKAVIRPTKLGVLCAAYIGLCALLTVTCTRPADRGRALAEMLRHVGLYAVWLALLLIMYFVSMPTDEALRVAAFARYNSTGQVMLMGLFLLHFQKVLQEGELCPAALGRALQWASILTTVGIFALYFVPNIERRILRFELRDTLTPFRAALISVKTEHDLPDGERYMVYYSAQDNRASRHLLGIYTFKYEFETVDICAVADFTDMDSFLVGTPQDHALADSPVEYMRDTIDSCCACLITCPPNKDRENIEAFLESYRGDTPIYYCYAEEPVNDSLQEDALS